MEEAFCQFNQQLRQNYEAMDRSHLREKLKKLGTFYSSHPLKKEELEAYLPGSVAAVDGSMNQWGGAEPNVLHLLTAVFLPDLKRESHEKAKVMSPLTGGEDRSKAALSQLEVQVAREGLDLYHSRVILMDGGFIRYVADAEQMFSDLVQACKERDCLLLGVIEDIKSTSIGEAMGMELFDREILFGHLGLGEAFILDSEYNKKTTSGVGTAYFRPSNNPQCVAIDFPIHERERIEEGLNLIHTLTPEGSRGIPLLLDLVDRYARVTDRDMQAYIKSYIDEDLRRIYLDEARKKRWL
ncbi:MAG: DNA double-strand break repair nuclease NurA [Tissierellia bacterium]|nr:DNA double-strand break repair nuclease NurA [Tissierellia bacterium]